MIYVRRLKMNLTFTRGKYYNGNVALNVEDAETGAPYAIATVNTEKLPKGMAALDTENWPEVVDILKKEGIITGEKLGSVKSGFCEYPIYKLNLDGLEYMQ